MNNDANSMAVTYIYALEVSALIAPTTSDLHFPHPVQFLFQALVLLCLWLKGLTCRSTYSLNNLI